MRRRFVGFVAMQDGDQGLSLLWAGALVDNGLHLALSLVDGPRPLILNDGAQPVQFHLSEMAPVDPDDFNAMAIAVRRTRFELAGAGVVATAVPEFNAFNIPVDHDVEPYWERCNARRFLSYGEDLYHSIRARPSILARRHRYRHRDPDYLRRA